MGREKIEYKVVSVNQIFLFLVLSILLGQVAATGIDISGEMKEVKSIANDGKDVFSAAIKFMEGLVLITDVAEARALLDSHSLWRYEEPANPETNVKEYFSGYSGNLPEVQDDVLRAWQYIKLAKEERAAAERVCPFIEKADSCIQLTNRMIKHITQGNKEAASAGQALNELAMGDLRELEHRGANEFYYHGPAYRTYYNAAVELKEKKRLKKFYDAMLFYSGINERLLHGKARVAWAMPKEGNALQRLLGIHLKAVIESPMSFHEPYNKLVGYKGKTGIKEMLEFKQGLVDAINSMDEYYSEWLAKTQKEEDTASKLEEGLDGLKHVSRDELGFFGKEKVLSDFWYALSELRKAELREENATLLKDESHMDNYLALATENIQSAYAEARRASATLQQLKLELNDLKATARERCWNSSLDSNSWVSRMINAKIKSHCKEGDSKPLIESLGYYINGIKDYELAKSETPIDDTRRVLDELEVLIEKARNDLNVSVEESTFKLLVSRFDSARQLPVGELLPELVEINEKAIQLREDIIEKANIKYYNLPETRSLFPDDRYSQLPAGIADNIGRLSEMQKHYSMRMQKLPASFVGISYRFHESPECNRWVATTIAVKAENPFPEESRKSTVELDAIPTLAGSNISYDGGKLSVIIPEIPAENSTEIHITARTRPLECRKLGKELSETMGNYQIFSEKIELNALTDLPNATVSFTSKIINSSEGKVLNKSIELYYLKKGKRTLTVYLLDNNKPVGEVTAKGIANNSWQIATGIDESSRQERHPLVEEAQDGQVSDRTLDYTRINQLIGAMEKAADTNVEVNITVPFEYTEKDVSYYRRLAEKAETHGELSSLEVELSEIWNNLMHDAKREVEAGKQGNTKWLAKARSEYNQGFFNRAIAYSRYAKEQQLPEPTTEEAMMFNYTDAAMLSAFGAVTVAAVVTFRRRKKTKFQKALERIN